MQPTIFKNRIEILVREQAQFVHAKKALSEWNGQQWESLTFAELFSQVDTLHLLLQAQGVLPGDRLIIAASNTIQTIVALFAVWTAQATAVLIDPDLPDQEILHQVKIADAQSIITPDPQKTLPEEIQSPLQLIFKEQSWLVNKSDYPYSDTVRNDRDPNIAALIFTSGTTGDSRAAMLTHNNFTYLMRVFTEYDLGELGDRSFTILPFFHVAGLLCGVLQPLFLKAQVIMLKELTPHSIQSAFQDQKPTVLIGVPRFLEILDQKILASVSAKGKFFKYLFLLLLKISYFLGRFFQIPLGKMLFKKVHQQLGNHLEKILCGSAMLSPVLQKRFLSYGFDLLISYGLTETCGPITFTKHPYQWRLGSVGPCVKKNDLKIAETSEVLYAGPAVMQGYFRDQNATEIAIRNGWCHTQDIGKLDSAGNLYIIGRKKDWIVFPDGKKAMPEQIEKIYRDISGIKDCAVFSVDKHEEVRVVLAFSAEKTEDNQKIKVEILRKSGKLNSPFRVHHVMFLQEIPRSNTLKVKRHVLKKLWSESQKNTPRSDTLSSDKNCINDIISCFIACMPDRRKQITADVGFVELGIDSLMAVQLCDKIKKSMSIDLKPTVFWFYHNIRELVQSHPMNTENADHESRVLNSGTITKDDHRIAVIGMGCRFPGGATNINLYWQNLISGKDAIVEVPKDRWDIDAYYDPYALAPGKMNTRFGGFIDLPNNFDAKKFQIKPREALSLDPQQKIVLMLADELLTEYPLAKGKEFWHGSKTGVFIGAESLDYMLQITKELPLTKVTSFTGVGMSDFAISTRISYYFDMKGPSMVVKTACSSSLVAVYQAVQSLLFGDCDYALAGGINLMLIPEISVCLTKAGFLSPDGRCKVFDQSANGYVRGEGCGLVLLKRYADAVRDGDNILATIEGAAINQDGQSNGLTAPNGQAQAACYQAALEKARIAANQVTYVESHGTGTQLGDAIEMASIQSVYDQSRARNNPLYVGAVKSQIGHCEAAAGIAGFIKTINVLQNQCIPPNLHYQTQNTHINFKNSSVILPTMSMPFRDQLCQYAAVSSFGISGTNVHFILKHAS